MKKKLPLVEWIRSSSYDNSHINTAVNISFRVAPDLAYGSVTCILGYIAVHIDRQLEVEEPIRHDRLIEHMQQQLFTRWDLTTICYKIKGFLYGVATIVG